MPSRSKVAAFAAVVALAACRDGTRPHDSRTPAPAPAAPAPTAAASVEIGDISFAGPAGHREAADFSPGEKVLCLFTLSNYVHGEGRRADLVADVRVTGAAGELVLLDRDLPVLAGKAPTLRPGQVRSMARLDLSAAAPPGRYTVHITARDRVSGRRATASADLTLLGRPSPPSPQLVIDGLHHASDGRMPAGSMAPLAMTLRGLTWRAASPATTPPQQQIDLAIATRVLDQANKEVAQRAAETLLRRTLLFAPAAFPVQYTLPLPRELQPGRYRIALTVSDRLGGARARAELALQIVPRSFGVYNVHVHDASHLPRRTFRLGEQIFVRFSLQGFAARQERPQLAVDLGIAGPDGGIYLARKDVAPVPSSAAAAIARAGRLPVQLPLVLPDLAPSGSYRLVIRARDKQSGKQATREERIRLTGNAPAPLPTFAIDELQVRLRPDLPPIKGDAFFEGRAYHLVLRVGAIKLRPDARQPKTTFHADLEGSLTLRDPAGKVVQRTEGLFRFARALRHRPLRIRIPASWTVPAGLPPGLYTFEVQVLNKVDQMVSQLTRRVAIFSQGRAPLLPL